VKKRGRLLVVDDDAGIRSMLSLALSDAGHEVRVSDGAGYVERGDAQVLILDVRLGRRTAVDLLERQPELRELPVVVMTASGTLPSGMDPATTVLLQKPFDLDALDAAVERLLPEPTYAGTGGGRQLQWGGRA
jgi:two-component system nitrogen regulation response regulator GlnG